MTIPTAALPTAIIDADMRRRLHEELAQIADEHIPADSAAVLTRADEIRQLLEGDRIARERLDTTKWKHTGRFTLDGRLPIVINPGNGLECVVAPPRGAIYSPDTYEKIARDRAERLGPAMLMALRACWPVIEAECSQRLADLTRAAITMAQDGPAGIVAAGLDPIGAIDPIAWVTDELTAIVQRQDAATS